MEAVFWVFLSLYLTGWVCYAAILMVFGRNVNAVWPWWLRGISGLLTGWGWPYLTLKYAKEWWNKSPADGFRPERRR